MAVEKTKGPIASNVIKEFLSEQHCMDSMVIRNELGSQVTDGEIGGMPVVITAGKAVLVEGGVGTTEASVNGIIAAKGKITLADLSDTTEKYPILARGPAQILQDGLPTADLAGNALTAATLVTAIEGNITNAKVRNPSTQKETQTT